MRDAARTISVMRNNGEINLLSYSTPIDEQLDAGEVVVWSGRPRQGIWFRAEDAALIPFSLLWCSFAIFWETMVLISRAPLIMRLWGIPFVLAGLYMVAGRFFHESWERARTWYAVTDRRILIVRTGRFARWKAIMLSQLPETTLQLHRDGCGTICFGSAEHFKAARERRRAPELPRFHGIADARAVFDLIRAQQLKLSRTARNAAA
jgi:hypothetical protein